MKKAFFQLHAAILLAGFTGILGRLITLNEGLLVWYRLLITVITLWILFFITRKIVRIPFKEMMKIFGAGFIAAMHWVTFYGSIKYANVSVALVCFSAVGFFTALLEPLLLNRKFAWQEIFLGLMVIAGIYLIFHFDSQYKTGIIIGIISALLGSMFPIFNRSFLQRHTSETVTLYELTGGLISLTLIMPFYLKLFKADHYLPTVSDFFWLLVLAWFCTVLAFQLLMNALKKISAFTVNLSYNLEPLYGILLAFLLYQENQHLGLSFYAGLALILLSVILQSVRIYHQKRITDGKDDTDIG